MTPQKTAFALGMLLLLSLGANVFLGGLALGRHWGPHGTWSQRDRILGRQMPEQDRAVLEAALKKNRPAFDALRRELDDARALVQTAQQADDPAALGEAIKVEQEKKTAILDLMRETRAETLQKLSPEGRAVMEKIARDAGHKFDRWRERLMADALTDIGGPDDPDFTAAP